MAYKKNDNCMICGACVSVCPVEAIEENDSMIVVNHTICVECEGYFNTPQCVDVCPSDACVPDPDHPKKKK